MANFMRFNSTVQAAFENNAENFVHFQKLLVDAANKEVKEYSAKEANAKIVEKFRAALGIDPSDKGPQVKRAIRANQ